MFLVLEFKGTKTRSQTTEKFASVRSVNLRGLRSRLRCGLTLRVVSPEITVEVRFQIRERRYGVKGFERDLDEMGRKGKYFWVRGRALKAPKR